MTEMYLRDLNEGLKKELLAQFKKLNMLELIKANEDGEDIIIGKSFEISKCKVNQ